MPIGIPYKNWHTRDIHPTVQQIYFQLCRDLLNLTPYISIYMYVYFIFPLFISVQGNQK